MKNKKTLFAIFKNGEHRGNELGLSKSNAIEKYIMASFLGYFLKDKDFIVKYSAKKAVVNIHY